MVRPRAKACCSLGKRDLHFPCHLDLPKVLVASVCSSEVVLPFFAKARAVVSPSLELLLSYEATFAEERG